MAAEAKKSLIIANRRKLSDPLIKKLFALSGNKCAMPKCGIKLAYEENNQIRAIICHKEAANRGGPRYNPQQSNEDRHDYHNLIILCPNCHSDIDKNPDSYTPDYLRMVKRNHEAKFQNSPYHLPESIINILKISVNQDEFSLNNIQKLFAIYFEIQNSKVRKFFYDNRLKYSLNNLSLKTLENDSTTYSELDGIFMLIDKLADIEFADCIVTLQNKIPLQLFRGYVEARKARLKRILPKAQNEIIPEIYWLLHEPNQDSILELIYTAGKYETEVFSRLIGKVNFASFDNGTKLTIEHKIWKRLDRMKDNNSNIYKNLLELDGKLFISLQTNEILQS